MENNYQVLEQEYIICEENITKWRKEVVNLNQRIAKDRQEEILKEGKGPINEEAQLGIRLFELAQELEFIIEELRKQQTLIDHRLAAFSSQYVQMKVSLPHEFHD